MGVTEEDWASFMRYVKDTQDSHSISNQERSEELDLFEGTKIDIIEENRPTVSKESLFERIGSLTKVQNLAAEFYDVMNREPFAKELRDLHPNNLFMTKKKLTKFLSHWLGGPKLFGEQYVNVRWLELRHRRFELSENNKQQWLHCMNIAMINVGIEGELKQELNAKFDGMIKSMQIQRKKIKD